MKRTAWSVAAVAVLMAPLAVFCLEPSEIMPQPEVIYGSDDRLDLYQVDNSKLKQLAAGTVALFRASNVTIDAGGASASLATQSYGDSHNLCADEPFREQRSGAFCSGSLVADDLVMTAGHCVRTEGDCKSTKFVFGFAIQKEGEQPSSVPAGEVYGCAQLVERKQENQGPDWAIVRLDRKVEGHAPLKVNTEGGLAKGAPLFVIGHPAGLPAKVAGGAKVRDPGQKGFFVADLDTYGGNSGSAVFNAQTGMIEGILVRGETDYESRGECTVSKTCKQDECRGEDVTMVSEVLAHIPTAPERSGSLAGIDRPGPALGELLEAAAGGS